MLHCGRGRAAGARRITLTENGEVYEPLDSDRDGVIDEDDAL